MPDHKLITGDCLEVMRGMESNSVDLVFTSPPYEDARTYGIDFALKGDAYVQWCADRYSECLRVSRGLTGWTIEGTGHQTVSWSGTPVLFMAELMRRGVQLWKPAIYARHSVPGKFHVFRNLWEWVVCSSNGKKLAYSDPTACGEAPKFAPGGRTRPRNKDGSRNLAECDYKQPERTNIGNVIWCGAVGGGNIGSRLATENEAPFPEFLAEVFVASFCPPGGTVLDPFGGSGTVAAVCERLGRNSISIDIRASQTELQRRRIEEAKSKIEAA